MDSGKEIVAIGEEAVGVGLVAFINSREKAAQGRNWRRQIRTTVSGAIRPRFYERNLFLAAASAIPPKLVNLRPSPYAEDSLFFIEASHRSSEVTYIPHGMWHNEVTSVTIVCSGSGFGTGKTASPYEGTKCRGVRKKTACWKVLQRDGRMGIGRPRFARDSIYPR